MRDKILVLMLSFLLLAAWGEVQLYSELEEEEANEILYVLLSHDISCSKSSDKTGFVVTIDRAHLARAVKLLKAFGLPRKTFVDLGEVFSQQGLVASPMEEKARFVYAISQELSETISNIDGVVVSRVHIVLPTENTIGEVLFPSSASVFIKYKYGADVAALVPKIKLLVANSVEGLTEREVSVTLFESDMINLDSVPLRPESYFWVYFTIGSVVIILLLGGGLLGWFMWRRRQAISSSPGNNLNPLQAAKNKLKNTAPAADNQKSMTMQGDVAMSAKNSSNPAPAPSVNPQNKNDKTP